MEKTKFIVVRIIFLINLALLTSCTQNTVSSSIEKIKKSDPINRSYQDAYYEKNSDFSENTELRLINISLYNVLISLKFTTYKSYISFDIDDVNKNKYLEINLERVYNYNLKDSKKKY